MVIDIEQEIIEWFNTNEVEEKAEYFDQAWDEFNDALITKDYEEKYGWNTPVLPSGPAYKVDEYGGEGQGDSLWVVFSVGDKFYKMEGYYSSWDGGSWEDGKPYEVEPHEVTVIQYREKK